MTRKEVVASMKFLSEFSDQPVVAEAFRFLVSKYSDLEPKGITNANFLASVVVSTVIFARALGISKDAFVALVEAAWELADSGILTKMLKR